MHIERLDHLVLTVRDLTATCDFYARILGMDVITFGEGEQANRRALRFGDQKINLHQLGHEFEPKAAHPTPGSADLCFITSLPLDQVAAHLRTNSIPVEVGPVSRTSALGPMRSLYLRDPDNNLIEIATYATPEPAMP